MRILILLRSTIFNRMGGAELQAHYLSNEFKKDGHEIHYIFDSDKEVKIKDPKIFYYPLHDFGRLFCYLNFFPIGNLLKKIQPDIIYQRVKFAYTGIIAYYAKKNSIKMVYNISSDAECVKNKIKINKTFVPNIINEYMGIYGIKNSNLIITQTHYQQKLLKQNFGLDSRVVPNGHPIPSCPFKKTTPPIVTWIANIKPLKQPEMFIKLAQECQDIEAQFIIVGRLEGKEYKKSFSEKIKKIPNLKYLGELPFEKTNELLSKASLLVNTSLQEGFPNTYIQAWMRETPVIALNADPDDLIKKYKIGYHSGNFKQMVKDIQYLIENECIRKEMGKRARKYAVENHDIKKIGKKYLEIFEELRAK